VLNSTFLFYNLPYKVIKGTMSRTKIVTLQDLQKKEQHVTETEDTETFYGGLIGQMKNVIETQNNEIEQQSHKIEIVERALDINNNKMKKDIQKADTDIQERNLQIKKMDQELSYYRNKETNKTGKRADVRKIVQEIHQMNKKKREKNLTDIELDAEAIEYLKKYSAV